MDKIKQEPVMAYGVSTGAVVSLLTALVVFGVVELDAEQIGALAGVIASLLSLVFPVAMAWLARAKVTPTANPHSADGVPLVPSLVAQQDG